MPSKIIYNTKTLCSCVHCKREITTCNIDKHFKSKACLEKRQRYVKSTHCKHCSLDFTDLNASERANHVRWCYKNPIRKQKRIKICEECGKEHTRRSKYCSKDCSDKQSSKPETRLKISNARKRYLKHNPEKHPWKNRDKFKSKPCEIIKQYLTDNNIIFVEEWQPLQNRFFSIDIAFPDIKVGIEINGNQHYTKNGDLTTYYQERHDLIERDGWKLIELHYSICFTPEDIIQILDIKEQPDYSEYFKKKEEKEKTTLKRGQKIRLKNDLKWEPFKELVINSRIDFSSFGWVKLVADLLDIKSQHVKEWMERYLPQFYKEKCFKRKSTI